MSGSGAPARLIWALGVTQIIGYGSLYYSFSILAPDMARDVSLPLDWLFAILSASLLAGGMMAPNAGRWADRFGAGRLMAPGSLAAGLALLAASLSPNAFSLGLSLAAMEIASAFVLYGTAFAAIVQAGGRSAQRSITHLTLIAGFASTLFWPLTASLHEHLSWRMVYMLFAALNILVCLPIHIWVGRLPRVADPQLPAKVAPSDPGATTNAVAKPVSPPSGNLLFGLMLAAFAAEGLVLSSILVHMVPLITALGLGTAGLLVSAVFGPSQVASRLINMLFGGRLSQAMLAVIAAALLPVALLLLTASSPWLPGVMLFAVLFGLGSGLTSIVGGTLPLELFGRAGYGARLGWVTAARQFSAALAPFAFAFALQRFGTEVALTIGTVMGAGGLALFAAIAVIRHRITPSSALAAPGE